MKRQGFFKILSVILAALIMVTVTGCGSGKDDAAFSDTEGSGRKTITVGGVDYFPRQDMTVILFMGIDTEGEMVDSGSYNNDGEADVVALAVFNEESGSITVVNLNRDTMVDMPVLGVGGKKAGTAFQQLALAHTYGCGLEDSCENTKETVSRLINNLYIDYYVAANMSAISVVNDAVGGVRVNVTDDFSLVEDNLPMGETVLDGRQAVSFIRMRKGVGDQLNSSRMERHSRYITGLMEAVRAKLESGDSFIRSTYRQVSPYMCTDISVNSASALMTKYSEYELERIVIPAGEYVKGEKFMEYYLDEESFMQEMLDIFYVKK